MTFYRSLSPVFVVASAVCFVVALLLVLDVVSGGNPQAWELGGLLALALSQAP